MKIVHRTVEAWETPVYQELASSSIHIWVPYKGWVQQKRRTKDNRQAAVPLSPLPLSTIHRWVKEKASRLNKKTGFFILFYQEGSDDLDRFGLAYDSRSFKGESVIIEGLPTSVGL